MTRSDFPGRDELDTLIQAISLELALVQPGSRAGSSEVARLMRDLVVRLSSTGRPECDGLAPAVLPLISELQDGSESWQDRHIESFSTYLMKLEALLDQPGVPRSEMPADDSRQGIAAEPAPEEETIRIESSADREFLREFCNEGRDLLQNIEKGVLVLEQFPTHRDTLNSIFRAFHTFKGGAGFLGLSPVKNLSHELESLLDAIRNGRIHASRDIIDLILAGSDCLGKFVDAITAELDTASGRAILIPTEWLKGKVVAQLTGDGMEPPTSILDAPVAVPAAPPADVAAVAPREGDEERTSILAKPSAPLPFSPEVTPAAGSPGGEAGASIRIGLEKLDTLVDLVAELVIAQSMVVEGAAVGIEDSSPLSRDILVLRRITNELQHTAMSLRMVPVRGAFQKMQRLVRDLASQQGKIIHLKTSGEETEIDRNIVAQLTDPLIHMVRNACDHGIETSRERVAAGKPPHGVVSLSALHQGGGIVIRISDDGRGLDPDRIRRKAVERGIIQSDSDLARDNILQLIFAPGFSTAETVTDLSGRGVGMDVVRGNIAKLRGRIEIESVVGAGTTFTIYLPLTLAIIQGMVVGVGSERFIIPTLAVRESFKFDAAMVTPLLGRGGVINRRGRLLPVLHVGDYLGVPPHQTDPAGGIAIIVESGTSQCCFVVDRLIGKSEVVIKDLGDVFEAQAAMCGAAILGDGHVALIIDVDHMVSLATTVVKRQGSAVRKTKLSPALTS